MRSDGVPFVNTRTLYQSRPRHGDERRGRVKSVDASRRLLLRLEAVRGEALARARDVNGELLSRFLAVIEAEEAKTDAGERLAAECDERRAGRRKRRVAERDAVGRRRLRERRGRPARRGEEPREHDSNVALHFGAAGGCRRCGGAERFRAMSRAARPPASRRGAAARRRRISVSHSPAAHFLPTNFCARATMAFRPRVSYFYDSEGKSALRCARRAGDPRAAQACKSAETASD
jgi:hypothetical protein